MAKDLFHDAVKQEHLKEQWVITADPLIIKIEGVKLEINLPILLKANYGRSPFP